MTGGTMTGSQPGHGSDGMGVEGAAARTADEHAAACRVVLRQALQRAGARAPETVALDDPELLGRMTGGALVSDMPLPPFDNSQMDGYAVCAADLAGAAPGAPVELQIGIATAAGDAPVAHAPGTASPVMTGAPIPAGADAVVPVERALPPQFPPLARAGRGAPVGAVAFAAPVATGEFVRRAGSDLGAGAEILPAGVRLAPARIGALAAAGIAEVPVAPRPRVLLCSTGDEITPQAGPGGLAPGRIHDANTPMLAAALRSAAAEVRVVRCDDSPGALRAALRAHERWADLLVTSGGISAGAFEVVREALAPLRARFVKVAMQPGGPQGLGMLALDASGGADAASAGPRLPALCFPGNPVSAMLSAELFLLPTLREHAGLPAERPREQRPLAHDAESPEGKLQLRRGTIAPDGRVVLSGSSSHLLRGLATAEVIAEIPLGIGFLAENAPVVVWRIHD